MIDPKGFTPSLVNVSWNQIAGAIDTILAGGNANAPLVSLLSLSATPLNQALTALSGEVHASLLSGSLDDSRFLRQAMTGRRSSVSYADGTMSALAADVPVPAQQTNGPMNIGLWGQGFGSWGHFDASDNAGVLDRDIGGLIAGIDGAFAGNWRVGLATGYSSANMDIASRASSANTDSEHLAAYAGYSTGPWNLRLGAANTWNQFATTRQIVIPGLNDIAKAHYSGTTQQIFGEIGYSMAEDGIAAEPFAGFSYVSVQSGGFTETGSSVALASNGNGYDVGYSTLGIRLASEMSLGGEAALTPYASIAWQHAFGTLVPTANVLFAGTNSPFGIAGMPLAEDSALLDAGVDFGAGPGMTLSLSYSGQIGGRVEDHGVKGNFVWKF